MFGRVFRLTLCSLVFVAAAARPAAAQTCVAIDERDTLNEAERRAAILLLTRQFEAAGVTITDAGCRTTYRLAHVRLGTTIVVTLSGPQASREGIALGLDDLPAVYSQLVRSILTGKAMGSLGVVDRTNVSATQDVAPRRVQSEGLWYARLGQATLFGPSRYGGATFGFGYRGEFNRVGLDVSFLNLQPDGSGSYYDPAGSRSSLVKMEGLVFTNPMANRTAYYGGGLSYGWTTIRAQNADGYPSTGRGAGLQGELTAGYEIARVTSVRLFVQADATLPFYSVSVETYNRPTQPSGAGSVSVARHYVPSLALSVGIGWQRRR
jgi:hypothetical protein